MRLSFQIENMSDSLPPALFLTQLELGGQKNGTQHFWDNTADLVKSR